METIKLEIVTPEGIIFSGDVKEATLPGSEGEFGVLPDHASVLTLLTAGIIEFTKANGNNESVVIDSGHVQVDEKKIVALVQGAVPIVGDSESDVAKALDDAKKLLKDASDSNLVLASVEAKIESAAQKLL